MLIPTLTENNLKVEERYGLKIIIYYKDVF